MEENRRSSLSTSRRRVRKRETGQTDSYVDNGKDEEDLQNSQRGHLRRTILNDSVNNGTGSAQETDQGDSLIQDLDQSLANLSMQEGGSNTLSPKKTKTRGSVRRRTVHRRSRNDLTASQQSSATKTKGKSSLALLRKQRGTTGVGDPTTTKASHFLSLMSSSRDTVQTKEIQNFDITKYYRSENSIEDAIFTVAIKKIGRRSSGFLHDALSQDIIADENKENNSMGGTSRKRHQQLLSIGWQQKIFSPEELSESDRWNNSTQLYKQQYAKWITQMVEDDPNGAESRLKEGDMDVLQDRIMFTKVDQDNYFDDEQIHRSDVTSDFDGPNVLSNMAESVIQDKNRRMKYSSVSDSIVSHASELQARNYPRKGILDIPFKEMYIMAAFLDGDSKKVVERKIAHIRYYQTGCLAVTPALSPPGTVYQFELAEDQRFEYTIELGESPFQLLPDSFELNTPLMSEMGTRISKSLNTPYLLDLDDYGFRHPPAGAGIRMSVFGEIVCAYEFERDPLAVQYFVEIPEQWKCEDDATVLSGYSQAAYSRWIEGKSMQRIGAKDGITTAHIAHPFEFEMTALAPLTGESIVFPKIYFHVFSLGSWGRVYTEGYGYLNIPSKAGMYDMSVETWKPSQDYVSEKATFFLGSSSELDDMTYQGIPGGLKKPFLNKYGFSTETAGQLQIKLNILHHSGTNLAVPRVRKSKLSPLKPLSPTLNNRPFVPGTTKNITDVLARAKARIDAVKEKRELTKQE